MASRDLNGGRYYANPCEQKVLVDGLRRYFMLPERSETRNRIAKEVSEFLRQYSPHWSHRAVRLWFNNNKHTYINSDTGVGMPPPPPMPIPAVMPIPKVQPVQISPTAHVVPAPLPAIERSVERVPLPAISPIMTGQSPVVKLEMGPVVRPKTVDTMPDVQILSDLVSKIPSARPAQPEIQPRLLPNRAPVIPVVSAKVRPPISFNQGPAHQPEKPAASFDAIPPFQPKIGVTFGAFNRDGSGQEMEEAYNAAVATFADVRNKPGQSTFAEYDKACNSLLARFTTIRPELVDPQTRFEPYPRIREMSHSDFGGLDGFHSIYGDDVQTGSLMFSQQFYAGDVSRSGGVQDAMAANSIWQQRKYTDTRLMFFESLALADQVAAITYTAIGARQRTISVLRYREPRAVWKSCTVDMQAHVEGLAVNNDFAWLLTGDKIYRAPLDRNSVPNYAEIPGVPGDRVIMPFRNGAVAGFSQSPSLVFVDHSMTVAQVKTGYPGIKCVTLVNDRPICAVPHSSMIHMVDVNGAEVETYIGHCGPVNGLVRLSDDVFASYGGDATIRVWDVRDRWSLASITGNGQPVVSVTGSGDYLCVALHDRSIAAFDIRSGCKPLLVDKTQDYEAASLFYNQSDDMLAMFGVADKEHNHDSIVFMDSDGQNRRRIFRIYDEFIGSKQ